MRQPSWPPFLRKSPCFSYQVWSLDSKHTTCMLQGRILQAARRFVQHFYAESAGFRQVLLLAADSRAR
ncbi:hypothetical protein BGLA2_430047 [Burkholderia gladioli]|nr:hypothetical protein BGLA2_430047 [Burkholderia gladioli]